MSTLGRKITAVCVAASFMMAALYCCCFSTIQWSKQKSSCCAAKESKDQKTSKQDCPHCNSSFHAELALKDTGHVTLAAVDALPVTFERTISYAPVVVGKSLFINGPPGPLHTVPLYIKFPSLRI